MQTMLNTFAIELDTVQLQKLPSFVYEKLKSLDRFKEAITKVGISFTATPTSTKLYGVKVEIHLPKKTVVVEKDNFRNPQTCFLVALSVARRHTEKVISKKLTSIAC